MSDTPLGQPLDRADGVAKVTGRAKFAADFDAPGLAHAIIVTSLIARGRATLYDTAAAERSPGVLAVLTPKTVPPLRPVPADLLPVKRPPIELRPPLADDTIHHFGQAVAVVVADTLEQAHHAASRVRVSYETEPPVLTPGQAERTAFEPETFAGRDELQVTRGDVPAGLRAAAVRVEATYHTPVEHHHPLEPSAAVAVWAGDALTVHDSSRYVHGAKKVMAAVLGLAADKVRIVAPFVGGAFGSKGFTWQHDLLAAVAAKAVGRPVKLALTRPQMATLAGHRPETVQALALGAAKGGGLTAVRHATTSTTSPVADFVEPCGTLTKHLYACPSVAVSHRVVRLNRSSPVFMRAPGELPGTFALESAMDELAEKLGLDPVGLRLTNHADRDEEKDLPWSSKHLKECYRRGAERFGWAKRAPKPRATRDGKWLVGSGMATAAYPGVRGAARATVRLRSDGTAVAASAGHEIGNGAYTVLAQVAADVLGLPAAKVRFDLGDSALTVAPAAGASQTTATVGTAVVNAAREVTAKLAGLATADRASPLFGVAADRVALRDGKLVSTADGTKAEPIAAVLRRAGRDEIEAEGSSAPPKDPKFAVMSFGAHFVEVRVDPEFGTVRVARVVGVFDPGRVLNPKAARSQIVGGVVMGLGAALLEQTVYDPRTGRPATADLADYLVPVNADVPPIDVSFIDEPDYRFNPTGGRGLGELGITGIAAAVANAVYHATGTRVRRLPITCDRLL